MNWLDGPKYLNKSVIRAYLLFIDGMNIFILELMSKPIMGDYGWAASLQWRHNEPFIQAQIKENIITSRQWPLCGEFTGDRWIPRTKDQ